MLTGKGDACVPLWKGGLLVRWGWGRMDQKGLVHSESLGGAGTTQNSSVWGQGPRVGSVFQAVGGPTGEDTVPAGVATRLSLSHCQGSLGDRSESLGL